MQVPAVPWRKTRPSSRRCADDADTRSNQDGSQRVGVMTDLGRELSRTVIRGKLDVHINGAKILASKRKSC